MRKTVAIIAAAVFAGAAATASAQPVPMSAKDFVMAAAGSDTFEIQAAHDAMTQSPNPRVRAFAREMIQDHSRTSQALTRAALRSGLTPPPMAISDEGAKMLAQIQSLRGVDFDRAYAKTQVFGHQSALVTEQGYAREGSDPNIRQAAQSAVPIIRRHLDMARQLGASLGGS